LRRAPHVAVYRKDSVPARLRVRGGTHGFAHALPSMGALFVAAGPDIAPGRVLPPTQNIHVYELLAALLGVRPAPNDGSPDSLRAVLRR